MFRTIKPQNIIRTCMIRKCHSTTSANTKADNVSNEDDISQDNNPELWDDFTKEFMKNRIELTPLQKFILCTGSSLAAILDPRRHDMIACLGETTGGFALENILQEMKSNEEGQRILTLRPRINTKTVDLDKLRSLPENKFGYAYVKFLDHNNVTPDSRMEVRFINNPELAYVMTRYRECHDLVHAILDMPTNMLGEVTVKWIEALNNNLPMCYAGAVFGAMRLRPKQRKEYVNRYLPWAVENGKKMKPLMPIFWEERWEQNTDDLRKELNITPLK
ncbi:ubiquinone biosynthesis protein COQ4 homolog, mitochondrial-like [Teleopsis dalmanni]|uniref:ubiquinone biosynthesis protein COQ4 homolog, mitochondrial-like n=1 Tax=Teleopsis dalmanni TaxID=139649 RepID=UPI0018CD9605|nr:ubiquinone biosynthesis protein COQ4 homolog, mitochondrial-like [Teleopsis dalmanni]